METLKQTSSEVLTDVHIPVLEGVIVSSRVVQEATLPQPAEQPVGDPVGSPNTYMGMGASQIEDLTRGVAGLGTEGRKSGDPLMDAVGNLVGSVIKGAAENLTSEDPAKRAKGTRVLRLVSEVATSHAVAEASSWEPTLDERFARAPLSGPEARDSLSDVLTQIKTPMAARVREAHHLPVSEGFIGASAGDVQPENTKPEVVFTEEEQNVAAIVISTGLEAAKLAEESGLLLRPGMFFDNERLRRQIEEAVLADDSLASGTPEEKRAIVAQVYAKIPSLMRSAFEKRQKAQGERHTDVFLAAA